MRTALAMAAFVFFAFNAVTFRNAMDGVPYAVGVPGEDLVYSFARIVFTGLAILSLAVVDWDWILERVRRLVYEEDEPAGD